MSQIGDNIRGTPSPISSIILNTQAGFGSTNTKIPYFTNVVSQASSGICILNNNAVTGLEIQATKRVVVAAGFTASTQTSTGLIAGLTVDSLDLSTSIDTVSDALTTRKAYQRTDGITNGKPTSTICWTGVLHAGQIIRPHTDAATPTDPDHWKFEITVIAQ